MPSAVFTSVTGLFTLNVSVCWPLEYEPPAIPTFACVDVTDTSRKIGFVDGKLLPAVTDSCVPLTEMTACVAGAEGGGGGVFGVEPLPPQPAGAARAA